MQNIYNMDEKGFMIGQMQKKRARESSLQAPMRKTGWQ